MPNNVTLYSNVKYINSGNVPTTSNLPQGNLAFGAVNGNAKLYGNIGGTIVELGGSSGGGSTLYLHNTYIERRGLALNVVSISTKILAYTGVSTDFTEISNNWIRCYFTGMGNIIVDYKKIEYSSIYDELNLYYTISSGSDTTTTWNTADLEDFRDTVIEI